MAFSVYADAGYNQAIGRFFILKNGFVGFYKSDAVGIGNPDRITFGKRFPDILQKLEAVSGFRPLLDPGQIRLFFRT